MYNYNNNFLKEKMNNSEIENLKPVSISDDNNSYIFKINDKMIDIKILIINIISFILLYYSFSPISSYYFTISYFLYPIDYISLIFLIISSILSSYIICLSISNKINAIHILYSGLYYIILFFIYHNKTFGISSFDKSFIYFYIFIFLNIQNICFYFIYNKIEYIYNLFTMKIEISETTKEIKNFFSLVFLFIIIILMHTLLKIEKDYIFKCDSWDIGLNGTKINNYDVNNSCQIETPKGYCKMDYFKGYFGFTDINNINCSLRNSEIEKNNFMNNLKNNHNIEKETQIFGFPYTNIEEKYSIKNQKDIISFGLLVNDNVFDINKKNITPETVLDFSQNNTYKGKYGELKINLNFNKDLSEKRKLLENSNSLYNNILMIYLDATSRAHFQRSFPKLSDFIKKFMQYDPLSKKEFKSFQFMKYHSFGPLTPINILPMFYGNSMKSNKGIHIVKYFKENGFITGHVVDMCSKEQYDISKDEKDEKEYVEWDHENIAYLCDGNYFDISNPYKIDKGPFSIRQRCLYGHPVSYYMIEYTKQFWEKYNINKKYFRIAFNYGHEKTGVVISYLDEVLYQMLLDLFENGYLINTAIFIVSDHGNQNKGIYNIINPSEFELEMKFGTFILLLYKDNKIIKKYENNLLNNQQVMVTPYDIHDTMIHIIYGKNNKKIKEINSANNKGNSVLNYIDPTERKCEKYDDWIKDFCGCF